MKTIQVNDDAMVIFANEMSGDEVIAFLDKWKAAIEQRSSLMWADVIVLRKGQERKFELTAEQVDERFVDEVNRLLRIYWRDRMVADEDFERGMHELLDKTGSKATLTKVEVK